MNYNYSKLLGRMRELGVTQEEVASAIGISAVSLTHKLKNRHDFKQREILSIANFLKIPADEIPDYFFTM